MIVLSARRIGVLFMTVAIVFAVVSLIAAAIRLSNPDPYSIELLFKVGQSGSFSTWVQCLVLLLCSLLLWLLSNYPFPNRDVVAQNHWRWLAVGFLLLSINEKAGVHEAFEKWALDQLNPTIPLGWALWAVPFLIIAALLPVIYRRFLASLPARTRRLFVISGVIFVGGILGFELIGETIETLDLSAQSVESASMLLSVFRSLEEGCELLGAALFLYTLLDYARVAIGTLNLRFSNTPAAETNTITLSPRRIALSMNVIVIVLIGISAAIRYYQSLPNYVNPYGFTIILNANQEASIPTWYSVFAMVFCAALLWLIAAGHKRDAGRERLGFVLHWRVLALIFIYLALDDSSELHERTAEPLRLLLNTSGALYFSWVIPGMIFAGLVALAYLPMLRRLPRRTTAIIMIGGAIFVSGAIGLEMVSAVETSAEGGGGALTRALGPVEELFEMAGIAVFAYGLLDYLAATVEHLELRFEK
ncbi:MAG: hypothetical protein H7175_23395 [Burkholderiales bacterium]|nr:hypothetical protein [Anaerolineae bacterium]